MKALYVAIIASFFLISCGEDSIDDVINTITSGELTELEVSEGLKEALRVGTDTASMQLGITDGYYGDELVKILLPPEADVIVDNISLVPGMNLLVDEVILGINRAAEDAAKEAGPIFWGAITNMSITDAFTILNGTNTAATDYLQQETQDDLFQLYNPKIQASLDKDLLGVSANSSWNKLINTWNTFVNSGGSILGYNTVDTDLDAYLTTKALDGLFVKVAAEEENIREDPAARVTDILVRVFE